MTIPSLLSSSTVRCTVCHGIGHSRSKSLKCPKNPRVLAQLSHPAPAKPIQTCKSCKRSDHSRSSHKSCPNNPKNVKQASTCNFCGLSGHSRRSHNSCLRNPTNTAGQDTTEGPLPVEVPIARRPFTEDLVFGPDVVDGRHYLGEMVQCPRCNAFVFSQERQGGTKAEPLYSICCQQGKVHLPDISPDPRLAKIVKSDKDFLPKIRKYNSSMSFASMHTKYDRTLASARDGNYTLKVEGKVTHHIGSLLPTNTDAPKCAQIYIYDPEDQATWRQERFKDLNIETLKEVQAVLDEINPLCTEYKSLREREQGGENIDNVRILLTTDDTRKQYNKPATSEVAILLPEEEAMLDNRTVLLQGRDDKLIDLFDTNPQYDPLQYVLLFPRGELGWTFGMYPYRDAENVVSDGDESEDGFAEAGVADNEPESDAETVGQRKRKPRGNVTQREFYAYRLQIRPISEEDQDSYFWRCGRLCHQYAVDQYARLESQRLRYISTHQEDMRAGSYKVVTDLLQSDVPAAEIGKRTVLPSSFQGGPRHMQQLFQDSMAIVRNFGRPDLFVTFTCNPQWPEIQNNLMSGQTASDRPDLCVRVFRLKLKALLDDLLKNGVMGKTVGYTWVVEFQKRGLPHAHILLMLADEHKLLTVEQYDLAVSAQIPDEKLHPLAYHTVTNSMVHGPCGKHYPKAPCMDKESKTCSKKYPHASSEETSMNNDGYPVYRRPRDGRTFKKKIGRAIHEMDNRWIVPHNLWLCTKYNAHINVEICSSIKAVKYLFKYVYKGHDRARFKASTDKTKPGASEGGQAVYIDEVEEYQEGRYVSACEALWRLFAFPMHEHAPAIVRLQVHLPEEQQVRFHKTATAHEVKKFVPDTTLTTWFKLNRDELKASQATQTCQAETSVIGKRHSRGQASGAANKKIRLSDPCSSLGVDPRHSTEAKVTGKRKREPTEATPGAAAETDVPEVRARDLLYSDVCQHYRYQSQGKREWKRRVRKTATPIGRMYFVPPKDEERFCLRLLLLKVAGATSFEHLRTVDGVEHKTFKDACLALDLLKGDDEWIECLNEARLLKMGPQLRHLFAIILIIGTPSKPDELWETFAHDLSEDILYKLKLDNVRPLDSTPDAWQLAQELKAKSMAVFLINEILRDHNSSVEKFFKLPKNFMQDAAIFAQNQDAEDEIRQQEFVDKSLADVDELNPGQAVAYNTIMQAVTRNGPKAVDSKSLFFIYGPGGTGKSFMYNTLIGNILALNKTVIVVATTGIAALILHRGRTAHSVFKMPIPMFHNSQCDISKESTAAQKIKGASAIFWDEAVMQHRWGFEAVDRLLRDLMDKEEPFGGKVAVFGGDFRQILPIIVRGSQSQTENACLKFSQTIWPHVETLKLTTNMRVAQDPQLKWFVDFLLRIGEGKQPTVSNDLHSDYVEIPEEVLFKPNDTSPSMAYPEENPLHIQFIKAIYPNIDSNELPAPEFLTERAILTPLHENVDRLNALATSMLTGEARSYYAQDSVSDIEYGGNYPTEFLNGMNPSNLPPFELTLKVGQPIILMRNLDVKRGLCNGTRMIVRGLGRKVIDVEIALGPFRKTRFPMPRVDIETDDGTATPVKFTRCQFPIKPAFVMTVNKSQGQTLKAVGLFLPDNVFSHGQLYVALSRCSDPNNLKVLIENPHLPNTGGVYTRNVVFPKVLRDAPVTLPPARSRSQRNTRK